MRSNDVFIREITGLTNRAFIATQIMASLYVEDAGKVSEIDIDRYNRFCAKWAIAAADELIKQLNEKQDDELMKGINL